MVSLPRGAYEATGASFGADWVHVGLTRQTCRDRLSARFFAASHVLHLFEFMAIRNGDTLYKEIVKPHGYGTPLA
jgi:hypothetical protein